jgi:hypothetical protein
LTTFCLFSFFFLAAGLGENKYTQRPDASGGSGGGRGFCK